MTSPKHPNAAGMYLRLAEGPDDLIDEHRSRLHRAFALFALVAVLAYGLIAIFGVPGSDVGKLDPAMAASGPGKEGEGGQEDSSGPGSGDDDDTDNDPTDNRTDQGTGRETRGNTDAPGQETGQSTVGETDPNDNTGATERTQGTGRETRGQTDGPGDTGTGASTRGETDPGDDTGKTERR